MGAWSTTIMGSDDAQDGKCALWRTAGLEDGATQEQTRNALENLTPAAWRVFFAEGNSHPYTQKKHMVAVVVLMECGATLPGPLADLAIQAAQREDVVAEGWHEPAERQEKLDAFVAQVLNYQGRPTLVEEESLSDSWARKKPSR